MAAVGLIGGVVSGRVKWVLNVKGAPSCRPS